MRDEVKIDEVDAKILRKLAMDSRTNLRELAKDCGVSAPAILKRIQRLKKTGVIVGTALYFDRKVFGYPFEATILVDSLNSRQHQIKEAINAINNVIVCAESIGRFNLCTLVVAKDIPELNRIASTIKSISGVRKISTNIWINEPYGVFTDVEPKKTKDQQISEIDQKILRELLIDAQIPFSRIAKKIDVSHETVRKRYEKMKQEGIIKGCSIIIDRRKLGYQGTTFILITTAQGINIMSVMEELKRFQDIFLISRIMGDFDIIAFAYIRDLTSFARLISEIQRLSGVERLETLLLTHTYFHYTRFPKGPIVCDSVELSQTGEH